MSYFEKKLWELLPDLYRTQDQGELANFLKVPAATLDDFKRLMDQVPDLFDVDAIPDRFLPLLAPLVGRAFDPTLSIASQRREIREAIEFYRRKGTIPAIERSLDRLGWQGRVRETFRDTLRLNRRAVINQANISGKIYSLGAYRVESDNLTTGVREALFPHHPAGTRAWYLQWLYSLLSLETDFQTGIAQYAQTVCFTDLDATLVLNRNPLNSDRHLTRKKQVQELVLVSHNTHLIQGIERVSTCQIHWHARQNRFQVNHTALNGGRRLPNLWLSERRFSGSCIVDSWSSSAELPSPPMRLDGQTLNHSRLNHSPVLCEVYFKQKDLLSIGTMPEGISKGARSTVMLGERLLMSRGFRLGQSLVSSRSPMNGATASHPVFMAAMASASLSETCSSVNLVRRWRGRRPGFNLNGGMLNNASLTDAYVTQARAEFELTVDTSRRDRVEPLALNSGRLNHTGLRLSRGRTKPMRLGRMPLNGSGFRLAKPPLQWRFRQVDLPAVTTENVALAVNTFTASQWPQ